MPNYQQHPNPPQTPGSTSQRAESTQSPNPTQPRSQEAAGLADKAAKAVDQAKSTALERVEGVRARAESGLEEQRRSVTDRIQRVGDVLRASSETLRRDDEFIAKYMDVASVRAEKLAAYLNNADFGSIADEVTRFARARPAWVIGGSFIAGLALGRFLKSTDPGSSRRSFGPSNMETGLGQRQPSSSSYGAASSTPSPYGTQSSTPSSYGSTGSSSSSYGSTGSSSSSYGSTGSSSSATGASRAPATSSQQGTESSRTSPSTESTSASPRPQSSSATPSSATTGSSTQGATPSTTQKVGFPQGGGTRKGES